VKIAVSDNVLSISGIQQLGEANSEALRCELRAAWPATAPRAIEIDLAGAQSVDSYGLGALLAMRTWAHDHSGNGPIPVRLLNPQPPVQQILELTRLHRTFEIVKRS
jgi:anti-sigma B factor antagonist